MEQQERRQALTVLAERLPGWYEQNKRILPWRGTGDPYDVWLSEIMLQQTRVEAVKGYFLRFRKALPDIAALATCPEDQLLKLWEGLGYYSRVRNLKKCAQRLMAEYDGKLPSGREALLRLPGIGSYTAGAIASIAYGRLVPAVDGNVLRVYARVTGDPADIADSKTKKKVEDLFSEVLQEAFEASRSIQGTEQKAEEPAAGPFEPGIFNQALMELGATVCLPNGAPLCGACPVQDICRARRLDEISMLPVKTGKKPRRIEERTVVILQDGDRFLIQKRDRKGLLAGLYEFPSLPGFASEEAVLQAVKALSLDAVQIRRLPDAKHIFTHVEWHMRGYLVRLAAESRIRETGREAFTASDWIRPEHCFATKEETEKAYALPSAFSAFAQYLQIERAGDHIVFNA